ncbi:MAG: hypothetical protein KatS3mg050_1912 [Litorilinea sp.]|nr:MAG: hypothetical protein KatS3mg050_1912 [Litorilinea sp.]
MVNVSIARVSVLGSFVATVTLLLILLHLRPLPAEAASTATGDLQVYKFTAATFGGAIPGQPISYTIMYGWQGDGPAPNVQVVDQLPPEFVLTSASPPPTQQNGNTLIWALGTVDNLYFDNIVIEGIVRADLAEGTRFTNTVTISGDVSDEDPDNDQAQAVVTVEAAKPDLVIWKWGLFEELEQGSFFTAEEGVQTSFNIYYFNWSGFDAPDATLVDALPEEIEFVSADPPPSRVEGRNLIWELGPVAAFSSGEVIIQVRPTASGRFTNTASITSTAGDRKPANNEDTFRFSVVPVLPPRLLKPHVEETRPDSPLILGSSATFEGLARAGATVTLYEGSPDGCWGDFSGCNPTPLISTTVASNRYWSLPISLTQGITHSLYLRAEKDGDGSEPFWGFWQPIYVMVDPRFEQAGWDVNHFTIETGDRSIRPGLGGRSGTTPNQDITIKIRQKAPDEIAVDTSLWANHALELRITQNGDTYTETLPVSRVEKVTEGAQAEGVEPAEHFSSWDFIYIQKGFGPGAIVEIWCLPVFYDEDGIPIIGLVYVKCHEMVIDPAGYVYDRDKAGGEYEWPAVPPADSLITNAVVTATVRVGDDQWERWPAEDYGQVNPQVTDASAADRISVPGYYAFYVPAGQYIVLATAPHCVPYTSPILTVVDEPIFHNVGMRCTSESQTGVEYRIFLPAVQR